METVIFCFVQSTEPCTSIVYLWYLVKIRTTPLPFSLSLVFVSSISFSCFTKAAFLKYSCFSTLFPRGISSLYSVQSSISRSSLVSTQRIALHSRQTAAADYYYYYVPGPARPTAFDSSISCCCCSRYFFFLLLVSLFFPLTFPSAFLLSPAPESPTGDCASQS